MATQEMPFTRVSINRFKSELTWASVPDTNGAAVSISCSAPVIFLILPASEGMPPLTRTRGHGPIPAGTIFTARPQQDELVWVKTMRPGASPLFFYDVEV